MARRRRRKWTVKSVTAKARERLHAMRMKLKPGYAVAYLKSLGFTDREIEVIRQSPTHLHTYLKR